MAVQLYRGYGSSLTLHRSRVFIFVGALALLAACAGAPQAQSPETPAAAAAAKARAPGVEPLSSPYGDYLAARHAENVFDSARAAKLFARTLERTPGNPVLIRRTFSQMVAAGNVSEGAALAKRYLELQPASVIAALIVAMDDIKGGRYAEAEKRLAAMPKRGLGSYFGPLTLAWARAGEGRNPGALAALAPLSKLRGLRPFHDLHHALINDVTTDREAAAKGYDALAANTKGSFLRLTQLLGNWYERVGDKSRARDIYAGHLKRNRDSLIIRSALLRLEAGKPPGRLVGSATDGAAEALFNLATLLHEENVQEIALILARLALHLRADFSLAQILVANIFEATDRRADAVVAYEAINPRAPISWSARLRAAYNLDRLGRTEEALTRLNRMAAERADRADVLVSKGDILRFKKRYVEAVETYNAAIKRLGKLEQQHWSLLYSRGVVLERAKRWKRAEADFLAALKLRPDQPLVLNYLGYSWVDQGQNLDRALGMIEKAVKLRPNDGYITDSLGWAHYRLGRFEKAVVYLERAVELSPRDATINDHLGDAYWHVGRKTEARFQWQRALALGPEPGEAGKIERKLARGLKSRKPAKREALGAEQDLRGG